MQCALAANCILLLFHPRWCRLSTDQDRRLVVIELDRHVVRRRSPDLSTWPVRGSISQYFEGTRPSASKNIQGPPCSAYPRYRTPGASRPRVLADTSQQGLASVIGRSSMILPTRPT
jgi:hypothetical protein